MTECVIVSMLQTEDVGKIIIFYNNYKRFDRKEMDEGGKYDVTILSTKKLFVLIIISI